KDRKKTLDISHSLLRSSTTNPRRILVADKPPSTTNHQPLNHSTTNHQPFNPVAAKPPSTTNLRRVLFTTIGVPPQPLPLNYSSQGNRVHCNLRPSSLLHPSPLPPLALPLCWKPSIVALRYRVRYNLRQSLVLPPPALPLSPSTPFVSDTVAPFVSELIAKP
ncbi:hypothetical protein PIB30_077064, partial [Stylosanthes scabra]|nr:hypothetical protein [Stylosanthes scabra]